MKLTTHRRPGIPPIRYEAVRQHSPALAAEAKTRSATVDIPPIGCGLAGGRGGLIEPVIERTLCKNGIDVRVLCYNCLDGDARTND